MYYVYILRSLKNGRLYTGSTSDIARRLAQHNNGESRYTKSTRPFQVLYSESYNTRSEATKREKFLKSGKGRQILQQILQSQSVV